MEVNRLRDLSLRVVGQVDSGSSNERQVRGKAVFVLELVSVNVKAITLS